MKEIVADLWDLWEAGAWIVVPTNGSIKKNGDAVMGAGVALQAKRRLPWLPGDIGTVIATYGNVVLVLGVDHIVTFPVKHDWKQGADLALIEASAKQLLHWFMDANLNYVERPETVFLPWVGCGNGGLDTPDVLPVLKKYLDHHFVVVTRWQDYKPVDVVKESDIYNPPKSPEPDKVIIF